MLSLPGEPGAPAAPVPHLLAQLADQLGVVVVGFDHLSFATGHQGSAFDEVRPEGSLSKKNLLGFQVHLSDDLVGNLRGGQKEEQFRYSGAVRGLKEHNEFLSNK